MGRLVRTRIDWQLVNYFESKYFDRLLFLGESMIEAINLE